MKMTAFGHLRRLGIAAALSLGALSGAAMAAEDWPTKPITLTVSLTPGGGMDLLARAMAPYLQEELGQPVVVQNRPGAGELLAHNRLMSDPDDGYELLSTVAMPYIAVQILKQDAEFTVDDFAYINLPRNDYTVVATGKDSEFKTAAEFVSALIADPSSMTIGVGEPSGADYINLILFLKTLGIDPDDVRIVNYAGGGDLRVAISGGSVDVGFVAGLPSIPMTDLMDIIMLFTEEQTKPWEAPTVGATMTEVGVTAPVNFVPGALGGFLVKASFRDKYPERWEKLVTAFKNIADDPEKVKNLEEANLWADWYGPEKSAEMVDAAMAVFQGEAELLQAPE